MKLNIRGWKPFKVGELFSIEKCKCSNVSKLEKGYTPYVGATNKNNGTMSFVENNSNLITKGNCIVFICDGQGSVGYSIYKKEDFIGSTTLKVGRNENINECNALFVTSALDKNKSIYDYGYKRNEMRLKNEQIYLPSIDGVPDWKFMEDYIRGLQKNKITEYHSFIKNKLIDLKYKNIKNLDSKKWKEFYINELFLVKIGKPIDGNKIDKNSGKIPYVTRKEVNNALDGFIENDEAKLTKNYPVITIGNETAQPYVQQYPFYTGTKVNVLIPKPDVSENVLFFITTCLRQQKSKFNYSYTINSTRLKKQTLMLPVNENEEPDYEYMEQYIKNLMFKKYNEYLKYIKKEAL